MDAKEIRIVDPFIVRQILHEQQRRGDANPTKTAARLISERVTQLEMTRLQSPAAPTANGRRRERQPA